MYEILPGPNLDMMRDKRTHNLISYAKNVEGDMYGAAHSKVYMLQMEIKRTEQFDFIFYLHQIITNVSFLVRILSTDGS